MENGVMSMKTHLNCRIFEEFVAFFDGFHSDQSKTVIVDVIGYDNVGVPNGDSGQAYSN